MGFVAAGCSPRSPGDEAGTGVEPFSLVILHTADTHNMLEGFGPNAEYTPTTVGDDATVGGMARVASLIRAERERAGGPVLVVDSGDFLMGSLFDWISPSASPALRLFGQMGYDAVTLGQHDFDWGASSLAQTIQAAPGAPPILTTTLDGHAHLAFSQLQASGALRRTLVKILPNGYKVGLFSILGNEPVSTIIPEMLEGIEVMSFIDEARAVVKELREQEGVDLVVALSHGDIRPDGTGDDRELAEAVPDIDVILSGHWHQPPAEAVRVGKTLIVPGNNHPFVSKLELQVNDGVVADAAHTLLPVDDRVAGDADVQAAVETAIAAVDATLSGTGTPVRYRTPLARLAADLGGEDFTEMPVGNLIADAYLTAYNATPGVGAPAEVVLESSGAIRSRLAKGKSGLVAFSDAYRVVPIGVGYDQRPGYPLVSFYLTGEELRRGLELQALSQVRMNHALFLQTSGLTTSYRMNEEALRDRTTVTRLALTRMDGTEVEDILENARAGQDRCYKVVSTLWLANLLPLAKQLTGLEVLPKQEDCATPVTDWRPRIARSGAQELKAWEAVVGFLAAQPDTDGDGVPDVSVARYGQPLGRTRRVP